MLHIIATLRADGAEASAPIYESKLAALRASTAAPKTPTYAHAKRLAEQASTRLDKAITKLDGLLAQTQAAQVDIELAALQLQQADATADQLLDEERANRGKLSAFATGSSTSVPAAATISIDKIMLGEFPKLELGSAATYFDGSDPEALQHFEQMQADLATHMQGGLTEFVQQYKARWEEAQKNLMQIVDDTKAKKRKADATDPPSPERTSNATSTALGDTSPAFVVAPVAAPPVAPQLPQNQVLPAQSAQTTGAPVEVFTQEARAAAVSAETEARKHKMRAEAMANAALQLAKAAGDKPVDATGGIDCCA